MSAIEKPKPKPPRWNPRKKKMNEEKLEQAKKDNPDLLADFVEDALLAQKEVEQGKTTKYVRGEHEKNKSTENT